LIVNLLALFGPEELNLSPPPYEKDYIGLIYNVSQVSDFLLAGQFKLRTPVQKKRFSFFHSNPVGSWITPKFP
jgi:hypothetical protein